MHDVEPQRVLYVQHTADMYGASRALLNLLETLDRRQVTPFVVLPHHGPMVDALYNIGVAPLFDRRMQVLWGRTLRSWRILPFALNMIPASITMQAIIRQHQIDIVHSNTWTNLSGAFGSARTRTPHVWHIREILLNMGGLKPLLARFTTHNAQHIICISQAVAAQFETSSGTAKRHVIYDGIATSRSVSTRSTLRQMFGIPQQSSLVGVVGRLHQQKGQDVLLRAFALLPAEVRSRCHCILIGAAAPGAQIDRELAALARDLGIDENVHFTGYRSDARSLVGELDLLVLPATREEGLGGVLLEAMESEVPVIASAVGGTIEVVDHGVNGLLVPPCDPQALATSIALLLRDFDQRRRMGIAGRRIIEQKFDMQASTQLVQWVYASIRDSQQR